LGCFSTPPPAPPLQNEKQKEETLNEAKDFQVRFHNCKGEEGQEPKRQSQYRKIDSEDPFKLRSCRIESREDCPQ